MRQIRALKHVGHLSVVGFGVAPTDVDDFIKIENDGSRLVDKLARAAMLLSGLFESAYNAWSPVKSAVAALAGRNFDVVIANDVIAVPLALRIARGAPVIFDGHEYSPREFEDSFRWRVFFQRYFTHLSRQYLPRTAASMVVCASIGKEYENLCGIQPEVVLNTPPAADLSPVRVEPHLIRMIHHGVTGRSRRLETMLEVMDLLDERFELDLMLVNNDQAYYEELKRASGRNPRIRFRDPVPMEMISAEINHYDIGIFLLPPTNLNYAFALPNKFFEFVQARLAVAIGPSPEMASIANEWGFGIVADDFQPETLAKLLMKLDAKAIQRLKENAEAAAHVLHAGVVEKQIRSMVERVLAQRA